MIRWLVCDLLAAIERWSRNVGGIYRPRSARKFQEGLPASAEATAGIRHSSLQSERRMVVGCMPFRWGECKSPSKVVLQQIPQQASTKSPIKRSGPRKH
jgi:hypothetical protein